MSILSNNVLMGKSGCIALCTLAMLASTAWTTVWASEFPAVIPLSSLDGTIGFRLDGVTDGDKSGWAVASAGDINGDGFADVIVGAPYAKPHGNYSGSSYVVFGKASGLSAALDLSTLDGTNGFRLDSADTGGFSGGAVAGAGDINGDGFDDLVVAGPFHGNSYVVFGKAAGFPAVIEFASLDGHDGFRIFGAIHLAAAGDFNGDGFSDLICGNFVGFNSPGGSAYVVFGKAAGFRPSIDILNLNGRNGFELRGVAAEDNAGKWVAGAGDVNGDGFADLIIGALRADPHGDQSGSSYVVFGKASRFPAHFNLASLDGKNGFRLDGAAAEDYSGSVVASAGDINGDGFADVIVGASKADPHGFSSGSSYVIFGKASGFAPAIDLSSLDGSNGFRLDGVEYGDYVGYSVAGADVNGDGFSDIIMGAERRSSGFAGSSYVVFGKAAAFAAVSDISTLDGSNGFRLDGVAADDRSSYSVAGGDVNGDGFADVIIGAQNADPHGSESGSSYVVFGRAPLTAVTRLGSAAAQYISGGPFDDTLIGLGREDTLEGRGGADDLRGRASKNDTASYLHSAAGVTASLRVPESNTGDAAGDSYSSIENLTGSQFADRLSGNGSPNRITGAKGDDRLTGGLGPDIFTYTRLDDSPSGPGKDLIADFNAGDAGTRVDRIDLSAIDARTGVPGNQAFRFIGEAAFGIKGQLRVQQAGSTAIVMGDVDGNAIADFEIGLLNFTDLSALTAIDFRL